MAKISNQTAYPSVVPIDSDYVIGTDSSDDNATKTFYFSDIFSYIDGKLNLPDLNEGRIFVGSATDVIQSSTVYIDEANQFFGINTITPDEALHVNGNAKITGDLLEVGSGHINTITDIKVIGEDINTGTNTIIDTYTSVALGGNPSTRYGNVVIDDRTLRLGKDDDTGATALNTMGILNFNNAVNANSAFSNYTGFQGYFPLQTAVNNHYFFGAYDKQIVASAFQAGVAVEAARLQFMTNAGGGTNSAGDEANCMMIESDANTSASSPFYFLGSQNHTSPSSRGIVTFDCRHQRQNSPVPDGHKLFEITSGYGQTAFVIQREAGAYKTDIDGSLIVSQDFTVNTDSIYVDSATNRVGINTLTPVTNLHVQGGIRITGGVDLFQQHENAFAGTGAGNQGTITGAFNAAFGKNAMAAATVANNNAALGYGALGSITSGNRNVAIGVEALGTAVSNNGSNIAIGWHAAQNNGGGHNIAIGADAFNQGVSGSGNIAIGTEALWTQSALSNSIAIGREALYNNTTGAYNIAIGTNALVNVGSGTNRQNIAIGHLAGTLLGTGTGAGGENNIIIGFTAQASSDTASNEITLGNSSTSVLRCAVTTITSLSDERDKTDIKNLEYGLDFINSLSPKQFTWNQRDEYITEKDDDGNETQVLVENANKGKKDFGFIAQEVQSVDNDVLRLVYDENPDRLEMSYGKLVPILVKAIQELKTELDLLKSQ